MERCHSRVAVVKRHNNFVMTRTEACVYFWKSNTLCKRDHRKWEWPNLFVLSTKPGKKKRIRNWLQLETGIFIRELMTNKCASFMPVIVCGLLFVWLRLDSTVLSPKCGAMQGITALSPSRTVTFNAGPSTSCVRVYKLGIGEGMDSTTAAEISVDKNIGEKER